MRSSAQILLLFWFSYSAQAVEYYWKPYNGTVPNDAILGGASFGYNTYIGRAPDVDYGLWIGPIIPGIKSIDLVTTKWVATVSQYVEVLCSSEPENLQWVSTNSDNVEADHSKFIKAGYYFSTMGGFYIGRILHDSQYSIGHINSFLMNMFFFSNGTDVLASTRFEALQIT